MALCPAPRKPALISEFGVLEDNWRPTPHLKKDGQFWHLHNALWASALSGLSGTVMHWFWDDIHKREHHRHYKPVAAFVAGKTAPPGKRMGHAGAIIGGKDDTAQAKIEALSGYGVHVAESPAEIGSTMATALGM